MSSPPPPPPSQTPPTPPTASIQRYSRRSASMLRRSPTRTPYPNPSVVTKKILRMLTSDGADSHADTTLISSDGTRFPTLRILLIASSTYFQKLLTSGFAESSLSEVPVSIPSTTLRQLLEFIYTDDCALIRIIREKIQRSGIAPSPSSSVIQCNEVSDLVEVADTADYTGVDRLANNCEQTLYTVMRRFPHIACTLSQLLTHRDPPWSTRLLTDALRYTVDNDGIALLRKYGGCDLTCGVIHLDESAAEKIFTTVKNNRQEQTKMFQALLVWVSGGTALKQSSCKRVREFGPIAVDTSEMKIVEDRRQFGKRIALWFDLKRFTPKFLSQVVETSGLLEPSVISDAYKTVSLQYRMVIDELDEEVNSQKNQIAELKTRIRELDRGSDLLPF